MLFRFVDSFIHSFIRSLTCKHCGLLATCGPCWHVSLPTSLIPGRSGGAGLGCFAHCRPWCRAHTAQTWFMTMNEWVGSLHEEDAMITPILEVRKLQAREPWELAPGEGHTSFV